ncbi:hypothetical protein JCM8547_000603 [Rhodosporidiobolus lusitaniae]
MVLGFIHMPIDVEISRKCYSSKSRLTSSSKSTSASPRLDPRTFILNSFCLLAGIVFHHLLPFPRLKHLRQPFSFRAFLPFLLTLPVPHLNAVKRGKEGRLAPSSEELFNTLLTAVSFFAAMTLPSGSFPLDLEEAQQVVVVAFRIIGDDPSSFARAERRAQEAILEELFGLKEWENAKELRREQQRWYEEE